MGDVLDTTLHLTYRKQDWKLGFHSLTACIWNDYKMDVKWMQTLNKYWKMRAPPGGNFIDETCFDMNMYNSAVCLLFISWLFIFLNES